MRTAPQQARDYLRAYAFGLGSVDELGEHGFALRLVDGRPEISATRRVAAADVRWGVQASGNLEQWSDASGTFVEVPDAGGLRLVGEPLEPGAARKFYRVDLVLEPGLLAGTSLEILTGAAKFGISGDASWGTEPASGDLRSRGGASGATSRIIAEVNGPTLIEFQMEVTGAGTEDRLRFYIDGIKIAETDGAAVAVQQELDKPGAHLLMWEFKCGTGDAVIKR